MVTRLQSTSGKANADTSFDLAYTSALTAGSYLVVFAVCYDEGGDGGLGVSSSAGHSFTPIFAEQGLVSAVYGRAWLAPNAGTSTPTITFTGGDYWFCVLAEYSGVDATTQIDATATVTTGVGSTSPNAVQSGDHTPVTDGCKLVAFFGVHYESANDLSSITEPSGFDVVATSLTWQTDGGAGGVADDDQTTAATVNPSWSVAKPNAVNMQWFAATFALRPSAGGGGDGTATPAAIGVSVALPAPTAIGDDLPFAVTSNGAALSTNDPSVTFTGYTPLEDDVVILFVSSTTVLGVVANASLPSGWVNPLGDGVEVNSDAHGMAVLYHLVTAAEETAVTTTYTATDSLDAAETGYVHGVVVRRANPAAPIDGFNTAFDSANTVTPHVLAGITGSGVLLDRSLVVSSVAKDATGAYSSVPGGWTQLQATNTNQGRWTGTRDAYTTVDTDVTATNITPSAGDEYCSITLALAALPSGDATANPAVIARSVTMPAPTAQAGNVAAPAVVTTTATIPAASPGQGSTVSPAAIPVTLDMFVAEVEQGGDAEPAATGITITLPAATATGSGNATAEPSVITVTAAIPAVTTQAGSTAAPDATTVTVTMPAAAVQAGTVTTPAAIPLTVTIPTATAQASALTSPAVIPTATGIPAPTTQAGSGATPSALSLSATMPAASTQAGVNTTPAAITPTIAVPAATASGSDAGTATPATITTTVTMPTAATATGSTAAPATVELAVTFPQATAQASGGASPDTITVPVTVVAATASGATSGTATPNVIATVTVIPAPTLEYGTTVNPNAIAVAVSIAAAVASGLLPDSAPVTVTLVGADYTITVTAAGNTATFRPATATMIGD